MNASTLLRQCADHLDKCNHASLLSVNLVWPNKGRFPLLGGDTELLSDVEERGKVYNVPIDQILAMLARAIKEVRKTGGRNVFQVSRGVADGRTEPAQGQTQAGAQSSGAPGRDADSG